MTNTDYIEEKERSLSLTLTVTIPEDELPENEVLGVKDLVREYLEEEYDIWYSMVNITVQDNGRGMLGQDREFKVAVID